MEGGEAVFDSRVIVEYVDTLSPVSRLIPSQRARARRGAHLGGAGRRRARRGDRWRAWRPDLGGRAASSAVAGLDRPQHEPRGRVAQGDEPAAWATSPGAPASTSALADIAVGCALGYLDFRFPHIDWRGEHTNLARLADKLAARQSFIDTVPT